MSGQSTEVSRAYTALVALECAYASHFPYIAEWEAMGVASMEISLVVAVTPPPPPRIF